MLIHTCHNPRCCPAGDDGLSAGAARAGRLRHLTIDLHCHTMSLRAERLVAERPEKKAEIANMIAAFGAASVEHNNTVMLPKAFPKLTQLETRLSDMDGMGVDVQVISPSPAQYYYWADPDLARDVVRTINEEIAEACEKHPTRIAGLASLALQHPQLACEQLEHAVRTLGLKGIEISTTVNDLELSHPSLRPVWAKAEELGAVVFIHPFGSSLTDRARTHYLLNTIGQPLDTTIALSHLIFNGVLDAYPKLKIVAAHGGGYLPTYVGRSDHAFKVRPEAAVDTKLAPSEHLKRIWYDSVVYDSMALRHLVERVGASQVVIGTDYPFDMGVYNVHSLVDDTPGLHDDDKKAILGGNAAALINWSA